jgi:hypothetical protein
VPPPLALREGDVVRSNVKTKPNKNKVKNP